MPYKDKEKQKEYLAEHYQDNKGKYAESSRKARRKKKKIINNYKLNGCNYCGEKHVACLDFHHIDTKTKLFHIASSARIMSIKTIVLEIQKCEVICSNCHRKLHWKEIHPENPDGII